MRSALQSPQHHRQQLVELLHLDHPFRAIAGERVDVEDRLDLLELTRVVPDRQSIGTLA